MYHPACRVHLLHTTCALANAQYDVRCPVCRRSHPSVVPRQTPLTQVPLLGQIVIEDRTGGEMTRRQLGDIIRRHIAAHAVGASNDERPVEDANTESVESDARRRYQRQRRRAINRDATLLRGERRILQQQHFLRDMTTHVRATWRRQCNAAWNGDEMTRLRAELRRASARVRGSQRRFNERLEAHLTHASHTS